MGAFVCHSLSKIWVEQKGFQAKPRVVLSIPEISSMLQMIFKHCSAEPLTSVCIPDSFTDRKLAAV